MPRRTALAVALVAALAALGGCGDGSTVAATPTTAFVATEATTTVHVTGRDAAIEGIPATVAGPDVVFAIGNAGSVPHRFVVAGADGEPAAEADAVGPGRTTTLAVRLHPGRWTAEWRPAAGRGGEHDAATRIAFTVT